MNNQHSHYQLISILSPLLDEKGIIEIGQKIKKWIEEKQGLLKEEKTIHRRLAYPIKKHREAVYLDISFQLSPDSLQEFQKNLKLENNILRYMLQKKSLARKAEISKSPTLKISRRIPEFEIGVERKPAFRPAPREKVKLEELDKKLEEILNE